MGARADHAQREGQMSNAEIARQARELMAGGHH